MIGWLIGTALAALGLIALLSPLESLRWWSTVGARRTRGLTAAVAAPVARQASHPHYVVYLSGVGLLDNHEIPQEEAYFCARLEESSGVPVVSDVFPYAVDNRGLLHRASAWFWRIMGTLQSNPRTAALSIWIQFRNCLQVLISADPRYGPTYHAGLAQQVWAALERRGYRAGIPVTIVGYSGGAQMALGVASFLSLMEVPCRIVSVGGVYSGDPGFSTISDFWDIRGGRDRLRLMGQVAFPSRWGLLRSSPWNQARADGRVHLIDAGSQVSHFDAGSYFDASATLPDGRSHAEALVERVTALVAAPRR